MVMTEQERNNMNNKYALAGWLMITAVVLSLLGLLLTGLISEQDQKSGIFRSIIIILGLCEMSFGVYAFLMFRNFLNEKFNFHKTDDFIIILITGNVIFSLMGMVSLFFNEEIMLFFTITLFVVSIPICIIGIMFGFQLLKLDSNLHGLLKPIAYSIIVASIAFLSVIGLLVGMIASFAFSVMLGISLILAEKPEPESEPEFV